MDDSVSQSFADLGPDDQFLLPITPETFEALFQEVTTRFHLPTDDRSRQVLAGFIHHIPNEHDSTTLATLGCVLRKSVANHVSWKIDQEIKEKARAADLAAAQKNEESTAPAPVGSDAQAAQGA